MTPRQIVKKIFTDKDCDDALRLIQQAISDERDACADTTMYIEVTEQGDGKTCRMIKDAIRARDGLKIDPLRAPRNDQ